MIFTQLSENNIVFNEADSKNKLTMDRTQFLKKVAKLIKSELGPDLEEHTTFRTDKDYGKNDFIEGKCEFVTVAHVKKSAEPYIGNQADNAKAILDMLNRMATKINTKIPSDCRVTPKYKGDPNSDQWDGWDINLTVPQNKNEFLSESYTGGVNMDSGVVVSSGNNGGTYIYDSLYESYIQNKIDAEERLALALKESMIISESDYSNIRAIQEAKTGEKIKNTWQRFVAFIKNMFGKFIESMTNILYKEKDYLKKYKDIILNKPGKTGIKFSYYGDYKKGLQRINNTYIPPFSYTQYKNELEAEDIGSLADKLVPGFNHVKGKELPEELKNYFVAFEAGQQTGTFDTLKRSDRDFMLNTCEDFEKVKGIVNKNLANIDASTKNIETEIKNILQAKEESTIFTEKVETADASENSNQQNDNKSGNDGKSTKLSITMQNMDRDENSVAKEKENAEADAKNMKDVEGNTDIIEKAVKRWIEVARAIVSAQLTAYQQITNDYMEIIRAHVRSYIGNSKSAKDDPDTSEDTGSYEKSKELQDAEKEAKAAGERLKQKMANTK